MPSPAGTSELCGVSWDYASRLDGSGGRVATSRQGSAVGVIGIIVDCGSQERLRNEPNRHVPFRAPQVGQGGEGRGGGSTHPVHPVAGGRKTHPSRSMDTGRLVVCAQQHLFREARCLRVPLVEDELRQHVLAVGPYLVPVARRRHDERGTWEAPKEEGIHDVHCDSIDSTLHLARKTYLGGGKVAAVPPDDSDDILD